MKKNFLETGHRERTQDGVTLVSHRPAPEELLEKERLREIKRKRGPTKGHRYKASVKGLSHNQGGLALWRRVKEGDKCELVLEPGNVADENAILVQWRGKTLGYLNAKKAKLLAPYIEGGAKFDVTVSYSQPGVIWRNGREDDNWHDISVEMIAIVAAADTTNVVFPLPVETGPGAALLFLYLYKIPLAVEAQGCRGRPTTSRFFWLNSFLSHCPCPASRAVLP